MARLIGVLGVALFALTAPAADPLEFKDFASKEGKFKVQFPGKAETSEAKKGDITSYSATVKLPSGKYFSVVHFDLKGEIPADQAQTMLKLFVSNVKGKQLSDTEKVLGKAKLPGRETVIETDKGVHVRNLLVLDGNRVYHVLLAAPTKDDVTSKDADKFFESFQVVK